MKTTLMVMSVLFLAITPSVAAELKKLDLDDIQALGLKIENDSRVKVEGKSSIKISTLWPTTVCLGEVTGLDIENAKLIYKANVKSQLDGTALLEMWVHLGDGQFFSRGLNSQVTGDSNWRSIQTLFIFQKGQKPDKLTLNLIINGIGTVWIDDIVLSQAPLE